MQHALSSFTLFVGLMAFSSKAQQTVYRTGDIIFQNSHSAQCEAVKLATHSQFSHVGIILVIKGEYYVLEAIEPVSLTPLKKWTDQASNKNIAVKRPKNALPENAGITYKIDSVQRIYLSKHYDLPFNWSNDQMYCSELVWKFYSAVYGITLCPTKKLKDFDFSHPLVKKAVTERYGKNIPWEEPVVSPEDIYQSSLLKPLP